VVPLPSDVDWRPPTVADAPALAEHTQRVDAAEHLAYVPGTGFFEWLLTQPGTDTDRYARVGIEEGRIVADCGTWLHRADTGARCWTWAEASPGYEHLRQPMIEWVVERSRERLQGISGPRVIRFVTEEHRSQLRTTLEAAGFVATRSFVEMTRPLEPAPDVREPPDGVEVVSWNDGLEEGARLVSNEAFADHWGSLPLSAEEFTGFYRENPIFRPDLSFLAVEGGRVVAISLCNVDPDANAERGSADLEVERVATLSSYRGRGLASVLIARSLKAAAAAGGIDRAALEVDESSHTNATAVYARLGFEVGSRSIHYLIEVDD
jgi:ribosomal protein S18 acetylase RimI-like enzyme